MKLFVWDYHGVLERGSEYAAQEITNFILERNGFSERLDTKRAEQFSGLKWYEYFERLLPQESHETHFALQEDCFKRSNEMPEILLKHMQPNAGVHEVLSRVSGSNHHQVLFSNTKPESLPKFLNIIGIEPFFPDGYAYAIDSHQKNAQHSKQDALTSFLEGRKYNELIIIGDSPGDMRLAEINGGTRYLYRHSGRPFRECEADYKINDLREILREL